jgi:hypothetical protein
MAKVLIGVDRCAFDPPGSQRHRCAQRRLLAGLRPLQHSELSAAQVGSDAQFAVTTRSTVLDDPNYTSSCCVPNYDVHPDGKQFIIARRSGATAQSQVVVISNGSRN